jgi:hypothetical protein
MPAAGYVLEPRPTNAVEDEDEDDLAPTLLNITLPQRLSRHAQRYPYCDSHG